MGFSCKYLGRLNCCGVQHTYILNNASSADAVDKGTTTATTYNATMSCTQKTHPLLAILENVKSTGTKE